MTKQNIRETTQNVVIPGAVAIAVIGLIAQAFGVFPMQDGEKVSANLRIATLEARFIEKDRQDREDRLAVMNLLIELRGDVRRLEGKLEK